MKLQLGKILSSLVKSVLAGCCLAFGAFSVRAQEITAIDFNGDLIGKVIPDGKVVSFENQLIGNITADSLIVNFEGDLIGGVVPRGIAVGNDNRLLGKVNNDGTVRLATGKIVGKVLPNGLVVDEQFMILGAVLFPGLVYSDSGETVGRLTGDGMYANLQGQNIGFVSPDGYAYRKTGNDFILDGRLISSKMIIDASGKFIGSVSPGGKVTDFDGKVLGRIRANGFAYDAENKVIGRIVKSGYAFDNNGKYIGFVTYNGEVVNKNKVVGRLQIDGGIADDKGAVIGYMADIASTVSDSSGKFVGRIMPEGKIAKARDYIGQMGPRQRVFGADGAELGQLIVSGPVFDYRGTLRGHALKNGQAVLLSGTPVGTIYGNRVSDYNGNNIGLTFESRIIIDQLNQPLGVNGIGSSFSLGEEKKILSPFGYVYNADGGIDGSMLPLGAIYNLSGKAVASIYPNGEMVNNNAPVNGRLTQYGYSIDEKNLILGRTVNVTYAVDSTGNSLGIIADGNMLLDKSLNNIAKILPDNRVVGDLSNPNAMMPVIGSAWGRVLALGFRGNLIGYVNADGVVRDRSSAVVGKVGAAGMVFDNVGQVIGGTVDYTTVVDGACEVSGVVTAGGEVRNYREVNMGQMLPNGQVFSVNNTIIGHAVIPGVVVDFSGNPLGTVTSSGRVINYAGQNLGCVNQRGLLVDGSGILIGKRVEIAPVMNFNNVLIGRSTLDGSVINGQNTVIGYVRPDDSVSSQSGQANGMLFRYRFAFNKNNRLVGTVNDQAEVVNGKGEKIGSVDFYGKVSLDGEEDGFALYDMYIYDGANQVKGYITADGRILSLTNQPLGALTKGFMVDKEGKVLGRGNRDFYIRDNLNAIIGELQLDGRVVNVRNEVVGSLGISGNIVSPTGEVIAHAQPLQFYEAVKRLPIYDKDGNVIGYVVGEAKEGSEILDENGNVIGHLNKDGSAIGQDGEVVGNMDLDWYEQPAPAQRDDIPEVGARTVADVAQFKRSLNIALTPDGEYLGDIMENGDVVDESGSVIGKLLPDGLVVDGEGSLIGIEEAAKKGDTGEMFVPAGTFGQGGAYGTGSGAGNLGPGGGFGPGERYDPQRSAALSAAQNARRQGMRVGKISTNIRKEAFDGFQKDWSEQGIDRTISSWRVDMSTMILADKPIPAVIARSIDTQNPVPITAFVERNVYAEDGRNVVIPAGSRLMGELGGTSSGNEETASESARITIVWQRLIRPDGVLFTFQGETGDAQGRGGALGYVDQQLGKKYGMPLITTLLTSATSYMMATDDETNEMETETSRQEAANDARQNFIDQMNEIFNMILTDKTNIRPLTYVPAGTRIIVYPKIDLWLRTLEIDAEASTNMKKKDVLIDDEEAQDRIATQAAERRIKQMDGGADVGQVVYESEKAEVQPVLLDDNKQSSGRAPASTIGAAPPPPPSTGGSPAPAASSSSSDSGVPQLF